MHDLLGWRVVYSMAILTAACGGKSAVSQGHAGTSAEVTGDAGPSGASVGGANAAGAAGSSAAGSSAGGSGAGGSGAGGSGAGGDGPIDVIWNDAWNVTAHVSSKEPPGVSLILCSELSFTLAFSDLNGELRAIAGRDGEVGAIALTRQADGSAVGGSSIWQPPSSSDCFSTAVHVSQLVLAGDRHHLLGSASGTIDFRGGDYIVSNRIDLALTGTLDTTPPVLNPPPAPINPLDRLHMTLSEPLAAAMVTLAGTPSVPLAALEPEQGLITLSTEQVLPFAGSWQLIGSGQDFAGHALTLGQTIKTQADPGLFAQDGFEGPVNVALTGTAKLLDNAGIIQPPAGTRALLVPPGGTATLHLHRAASQNDLRFTVVQLSVGGGGFIVGYASATVAVLGGTHRWPISWLPTVSSDTGDATWPKASQPTLVRTTLDEAGTDVVLRFAPMQCGGGLCPPQSALLIDDVRLE
jgi:hypothetical protein